MEARKALNSFPALHQHTCFLKKSILQENYIAIEMTGYVTDAVHIYIGVLAESRCFASFTFWAGFFGRITDENTLKHMKAVGDIFMDTHNNCWVAWAEMGQDHICRPELYLDRFIKKETRIKLTDLIKIFKRNDEKAIGILTQLCVGSVME